LWASFEYVPTHGPDGAVLFWSGRFRPRLTQDGWLAPQYYHIEQWADDVDAVLGPEDPAQLYTTPENQALWAYVRSLGPYDARPSTEIANNYLRAAGPNDQRSPVTIRQVVGEMRKKLAAMLQGPKAG
jgi:hypothetical protein